MKVRAFVIAASAAIAAMAFPPSASAVGLSLGTGGVTLTATTTGWTNVNTGLGAGNGLVTSGFTDPVRVVISVPGGNGLVRLTSTTGLAQATGYSNWTTGTVDLGFFGTMADVNAGLASLEYRGSSLANGVTLRVDAAINPGSGITFNPDNGHYYQYVSTGYLWIDALANAPTVSLSGLPGYLATSTSAAENAFITDKTGGASAWLSGTDNGSYTNASEGVWAWAAGPEAGTVFWRSGVCATGLQGICANTGKYNNWTGPTGPQPDNWTGLNSYAEGEDALQLLAGGTGRWNDRFHNGLGRSDIPSNGCTTNCQDIMGYVREFSAADGGAVPNTFVTRDVTVNVVGTVPGVPSGVSVVPGDGRASVSWTAPVSGGTPSSYTVSTGAGPATCTAVSPALTCVVTGLANGSSYSFSVTATNAVGSGSPSSASSSVVPRPYPAAPGSVALSGATLTWASPALTYSSSQDRVYVFYRATTDTTGRWKVLAWKSWSSGGGSITLGATTLSACSTLNPGWTCVVPSALTPGTSYQYRVATRRPAVDGDAGGVLTAPVTHTTTS